MTGRAGSRSLERTPEAGRWVFFLEVRGGVTVSHWVWGDGRGCDEMGPLVERYRCPCGWQVEGSEEICARDYREHRATGCPLRRRVVDRPRTTCLEPCDHCRPDAWHGCVRPRGHRGWHSCRDEDG